jgi:hypothetical protein
MFPDIILDTYFVSEIPGDREYSWTIIDYYPDEKTTADSDT